MRYNHVTGEELLLTTLRLRAIIELYQGIILFVKHDFHSNHVTIHSCTWQNIESYISKILYIIYHYFKHSNKLCA